MCWYFVFCVSLPLCLCPYLSLFVRVCLRLSVCLSACRPLCLFVSLSVSIFNPSMTRLEGQFNRSAAVPFAARFPMDHRRNPTEFIRMAECSTVQSADDRTGKDWSPLDEMFTWLATCSLIQTQPLHSCHESLEPGCGKTQLSALLCVRSKHFAARFHSEPPHRVQCL